MKIKNGFTLMELLIVVALISIIAVTAIVLFNPFAQLGKGYDVKRKHELAQLQKALEDYYNDKGCYPKPADLCYSLPPNLPPTKVCGGVGGGGLLESFKCNICGNESSSPPFSPYLSKLPCDPQHKQKQYLYEVAAKSLLTCNTAEPEPIDPCPQWYRVYSSFSNKSDSSTEEIGCQMSGCGMKPNYGYDYGVTSPNEKLRKTSVYYYFTQGSTCDVCSSYEFCKSTGCSVYPSSDNCNAAQPQPPHVKCSY